MNDRVHRHAAALAIAALAVSCATASLGSRQESRPKGPTSCSGTPSNDSTVYDSTRVTEQPIARSGPMLQYPRDARDQGIEGRVQLSIIVNANGAIDQRSITVVRTVYPSLDAAARHWARGATYWPGCLDGHAVRVRLVAPIDFSIGISRWLVAGCL